MNKEPNRRATYEQARKRRSDILKIDENGRLAALVTTPKLTIAVADAQDALYQLLTAYQRAVPSPANADHVGHVILALKSTMDFLDTVAGFGIEDRQKPNPKPDESDDNT